MVLWGIGGRVVHRRTSDDDDDGVSSIGIKVEGILFVDCCIVEIVIIDLSLAALS